MKGSIAISIIAIWSCAGFSLAADENNFGGNVSATLTRAGTEATHFLFARKGNRIRIENSDKKLEPINIVDFDATRLTILFPHNTTFVQVDLTRASAPSSSPPLPPSLGSAVSGPPNFPTAPNLSAVQPGAQVGPSISPPPGFPSPPSMPSIPKSQAATPVIAMPALPPMSAMPSMMGAPVAPDFKKSDQTRKILGFDCALYTISDRGQKFEIWATNDAALFPFRLLERDFLGRRFGPRMLEETWPELLRNQSLFPLEAILKMEPGGQERLSFKVDKIKVKKIEDEKLFAPPDNFLEIQAPTR
ncbi:hypothetical protein AYO41_00675 [Verrucomicrobia bacterium SCGC AG-212-E04]|nr:hypothetical protein AYO41_00675 [Verrucomicrobia bacterium SCGC AG-212-E04]